MSEISLEQLLEYTCKTKSTDLHISVGAAPMVRRNAQLEAVEGCGVIQPDDAAGYVDGCASEAKRKILDENGEVDFSFSRAGLGRFRANIYKQRGSYSIAIRSLPFAIPDFSELGLPEPEETGTTVAPTRSSP